jgi:hypothetical protein
VVSELDWLRLDASGGRVRKSSVTNTGAGMTGDRRGLIGMDWDADCPDRRRSATIAQGMRDGRDDMEQR